MKVTHDTAHRWLSTLIAARPAYVETPVRDGYRRGLEAMTREQFAYALHFGLEHFHHVHGRLPDLIEQPGLVDHYFAMKYFGFVPSPNPADKLNTGHYVPEHLRDEVRVLNKPYIGTEPRLPPDDAVAPGAYYMKRALGCKTNRRIEWPPTAEERRTHEETLRLWSMERYGLRWGEWWYAWGPERWFLEEDITDSIKERPNWMLFVRRGQAVLGAVLYGDPTSMTDNDQAWFDGDCNRLDVITRGRRPLKRDIPERTGRYLEIAAEIGAPFDVVRIDFWDTSDGRPVLAELTLCDYHCQRVYEPETFGLTAGRILFETEVGMAEV